MLLGVKQGWQVGANFLLFPAWRLLLFYWVAHAIGVCAPFYILKLEKVLGDTNAIQHPRWLASGGVGHPQKISLICRLWLILLATQSESSKRMEPRSALKRMLAEAVQNFLGLLTEDLKDLLCWDQTSEVKEKNRRSDIPCSSLIRWPPDHTLLAPENSNVHERIFLRDASQSPPTHIHIHLVCSLTHKFKNRSHGVAMTPGATPRFFQWMRFPFRADLSESLTQSGL